MEKLLRRSEQAARVAAKRATKRKAAERSHEVFEYKHNEGRQRARERQTIREAAKQRKKDWEAGALAPRRDVGSKATTWGSINMEDAQGVAKPTHLQPKWLPFAVGDRVVITKGHDSGKMGYLSSVEMDKAMVRVKNLNLADVWVPDWIRLENQWDRSQPLAPSSIPLSYHDVKLVYPLPDPETGILRDVIIEQLEEVEVGREAKRIVDPDHREKQRAARAIPGTDTIIPWPAGTRHDLNKTTEPDDTPRMTVEEETYKPSLLYPPMPISVIDELRNKYSKFRTKHDYDYVQKKEAEVERGERRKQLGKTMRTPLQELAELRARQREVEKSKELTDNQLAKIGEVMAQRRSPAKVQAAAES